MPAYDFRCKECFYVFEVRASISEYDVGLEVDCPTCGSDEVVRVIGAAGFLTAGAPSSSAAPEPSSNGHSCGCGGGCGH